MEYFIGSVITLAAVFGLNLIFKKKISKAFGGIQASQSYIFNLIERYLPEYPDENEYPVTQATKYLDKIFVRVVIVDDKAYWVENNRLYVTDHEDDTIDKSSAQEVDTMAMDKVQLDKIMLVVEKLKEGVYDDSWDAGE